MPVHKVGCFDDTNARVIRIVHISDTHMRHDSYLSLIPTGDILIHSGDFSAFTLSRYFGNKTADRQTTISNLDSFFEKQPFKHKIFVPGNHELSFKSKHKDTISESLKNVIYLQDQSVTVEGINIYGSPWSSKRWYSYARGFSENWGQFEHNWKAIPSDTDILVTHMPPEGIKDLAARKFKMLTSLFAPEVCELCGGEHAEAEHWGCRQLRENVLKRVRPVLHMFGHVHEDTGVEMVDGITFSNAAMKIKETVNVFDYYVKKQE